MLGIASHISWHSVEGELALFDTRDGSYHALNASAAEIWRGIANRVPLDALTDALAAAHRAPREAIAQDIGAFVEAALAKGLLVEE